VLASADGESVKAVARLTGKSKPCVWRWQERFAAEGVDGLLRDKTRPPGRKPLSQKLKLKVLKKTAKETPPAATHWSVRRRPPRRTGVCAQWRRRSASATPPCNASGRRRA
jgi:transposase